MKIKAVFFDAGETLIYRNPSLVTISRRCFIKAGIKIEKSKLAGVINSAAAEMRPIVERGKMKDSDKWSVYIGKIFRKLRINDRELARSLKQSLKTGTSFKAYRDAAAVVDLLNKKGVKTGVISNAPSELEGILKRAKLFDKFRYVVISEKAGVEKPHKKIFLKALKMSRTRAAETVYIGDNYVADIYGARNAGMIPVWINRKSKNAEFSFSAVEKDNVQKVSSLSGFIKFLKKEEWL